MNKKFYVVLLVILAASLMISTASASNKADHAAGIGTMAHPTSSAGMEVCKGCHGDLGSATTSGFCTGCHAFPVFTATATVTPVVTATQAVTAAPTVTATTVAVTAAPAVTTVTATETSKTPGFGIVAAMVGLFVCSLLVKRNNK